MTMEEAQQVTLFDMWYDRNRAQLYTRYPYRLQMAVRDTARAAWFAGNPLNYLIPAPAPIPLPLEQLMSEEDSGEQESGE